MRSVALLCTKTIKKFFLIFGIIFVLILFTVRDQEMDRKGEVVDDDGVIFDTSANDDFLKSKPSSSGSRSEQSLRRRESRSEEFKASSSLPNDDDDDDDNDRSPNNSNHREEEDDDDDDKKCSKKHGMYDKKARECKCSVFYKGSRCEEPREFPQEIKNENKEQMVNFSTEFEGDIAINRARVMKDGKVAVTLPGKEKDLDGGYRVLVPGEEPLFSQFAKILPEFDEVGLKFFNKCAVVGSSGIVLNYDNGEDIDQHDMVFRFNSAPTRGFEKHVGSKTTYRITNTQNWGFHEPKTNESILIHFRAKSAIKGLFWNSKQKKPLKLYAFAPDFVEYVATKLNFLATSGLYGILLAMHKCNKVDIYGFQITTQHGALYHYYDACDVPANVERDDSEWIVIRELEKLGLINFMEPCVKECHESLITCDACKTAAKFTKIKLPSKAKCDPNAVSKGHQEVPWRVERRNSRHNSNRHHSNLAAAAGAGRNLLSSSSKK
jgi:hypothetical protein